jgi:DNA-directed RNA polymerase subunit RPC12/RpoP
MQLVMRNDDSDVKFLETSVNDNDCGDGFRIEDLLDTEIAEENKEFNSTPFAAIEDMPDLEGHIEPTTSNYVLRNENQLTERSAEDVDLEYDDVLNTENNENLIVMEMAKNEMGLGNYETTETNNDALQNRQVETTSFRNPVIKSKHRTSSKSAGGDGRFHCHCGKSFSQKGHLANHKKTHDNKFEASLRCSECGKKLSGKIELNRHVKSIHQGYFYECPICGNRQSDNSNSLRHIKKHHPGSVAKPIEKCDKQ